MPLATNKLTPAISEQEALRVRGARVHNLRNIDVAIRQKNSTRNPRSTVATSTEIYDYLRLLFARCGQTFCIKCGEQVRRDSPDEIASRILSLTPGRRFYVLYPLRITTTPQATGGARRVPKKKTAVPPEDALKQALSDLQKRGFNRLFQDGRVH